MPAGAKQMKQLLDQENLEPAHSEATKQRGWGRAGNLRSTKGGC
jgi:hypothetical protein